MEAFLLCHPKIADCGVISIPDGTGGEILRAYVVKRSGAEVTEEEIIQFVAGNECIIYKIVEVQIDDEMNIT